jgi:hypothetical protein
MALSKSFVNSEGDYSGLPRMTRLMGCKKLFKKFNEGLISAEELGM